MGTVSEQVTGTRQKVYSANLGTELIVCQCGWTREAEAEAGIEAIIAGEVVADRYWIATQDGRGYVAEWAREGDDSGEAVYVEKWDVERGYWHGWIDVSSRKIVQSG